MADINCPKCKWEPKAADTWCCTCGHEWNTFDTGGTCPSCNKTWEDTQCHHCERWSPHLNWYKGFDKLLKVELEKITYTVQNK